MSTTQHLRKVRSFVRRQGRLTKGQLRALDEIWPLYGIEVSEQWLDLDLLFKRQARRVLEVGFGNGTSLAEMAKSQPESDFIGIEVHRPGIGNLLLQIEAQELSNIRLCYHDAIEVLQQQIPDNSLDQFQLFFPDPWQKNRHHKRRIVQAPLLDLLAKKLKKGGTIHMATDWENYAMQMMAQLNNHPAFENSQQENQFAPRPDYRPLTHFEQRGHRLGHGVWDLIFHKK